MKTVESGKKISLNKETIANLNKEELRYIKGGGKVTWVNCPLGPLEPPRPSDFCAAIGK
jgi:natural product precursor